MKGFELSKFVVCTNAGLSSESNRKFNNQRAEKKVYALDPDTIAEEADSVMSFGKERLWFLSRCRALASKTARRITITTITAVQIKFLDLRTKIFVLELMEGS